MRTFTTGVLNGANAAAVGLAMAEQIRDDVVLHPAWELVEEFTASAGLVRWYVFKCLATESGLPDDFHVVMGRTLASGKLWWGISEDYDSATHTMMYLAPYTTHLTVTYDGNGRNPGTHILGTDPWTTTTNHPKYMTHEPNAATAKWWLVVAEDGITFGCTDPSDFVHIGAYEPLTAVPIDLPIQIIGSSDTSGGITRNPATNTPPVQGYALGIEGGGYSSMGYGPTLGFRGEVMYPDKLQNDTAMAAEQGITVLYAGGNSPSIHGWALGKQKRMRLLGGALPPAFAWGDSYRLDGTLWVPYKLSDYRIWDTGVPV